jgi:hypothetical protein
MTISEPNLPGQESSLQDRSPRSSFAGNGYPGGMLSMDFSAPLTEQARAERIKQMSKNHVGNRLIPVVFLSPNWERHSC